MSSTTTVRDRARRELTGTIAEVIWADDSQPVVIAKLRGGEVVKGRASSEEFTHGLMVRLLGQWQQTPRYGDQFAFDSWVVPEPVTQAAIVKYLSKYCEDISEAKARKLAHRYGGEAVAILRTDPARVAADGMLSIEAATAASEALTRLAATESTKLELHGLFAGRGFPGTLIDRAIEKWGAKAARTIRRNPYAMLLKKLPGAGWKRCDRLYLDLGHRRDATKRAALCAWYAISSNTDGHTWHPVEAALNSMKEAIPGLTQQAINRAFRVAVRAGLLSIREEGGRYLVAERRKADAERRLADAIVRLTAGGDQGAQWPAALGGVSDHQAEIWRDRIAWSPVAILAGSPGTGKTYTLAAALRELVATHGESAVAVCAPTGKAAVRASEALALAGLPIRATTIHTLLGIGKSGHDGDGWGFNHNRDNPLPYRFVVVDESSMLDTTLLADLLDACAAPQPIPLIEPTEPIEGQPVEQRCRRCNRGLTDDESRQRGYGPFCARLVGPEQWGKPASDQARRASTVPAIGTHVLFVGDPYQLPPVGHGAPLRDMLAAGVPAGELTEIRRNAGDIVKACHQIKGGGWWRFSERYNPAEGHNLRLIEVPAEAQQDTIVEILQAIDFDPFTESQVIVARNKGGNAARRELNQRLQQALNPDGFTLAPNPFRVGDKIINLKNGRFEMVSRPAQATSLAQKYLRIWDAEGKEPRKHYLANGEIGRVVAVDAHLFVGEFPTLEGSVLVKVPMGKRKEADDDQADDDQANTGCSFDLGYAVTCHKLQGSEAPCVIVVADDQAGRLAGREWWYTALSRAKRLCIVVGNGGTVMQQSARCTLQRRRTFLIELLKEGMK